MAKSRKSSFIKKSASFFSCARLTQRRSPSSSPSRTPLNPQPPQPLPSSSSQPPQPPSFFLCPISSSLMFDPFIISSGHSFERNCIQACIDLDFIPPHINILPPSSSSSSSSSLILTPNLALKHTILHWCHHSNHPPPTPISPEVASLLVYRLMPNQTRPPPPSPSPFPSRRNPPSSSSPSSSETHEQRILKKLLKPNLSSRESGLAALIKTPVCTQPILNAIIPFLNNQLDDNLQALAATAIFTLTLDPANRTMILYSGVVQPLLAVLNTGSLHGRARATGAIYKLAIDENNRIPIGYSLGAIRPLLKQFLNHSVGRKKATFALYYLCLCRENLMLLVDIGGVEKVMEKVGEECSTSKMRRYALILLYSMVGIESGRVEVLETGGKYLKVLLRRVKEEGEEVGVHCLMVMYRVCRESLKRFREVAVEAGAEEVLRVGAEDDDEVVNKCWGEYGREMAREIVRVIRGEISDGKELKEAEMVVESVEREVEDEDEDENEDEDEQDPKGKKKLL